MNSLRNIHHLISFGEDHVLAHAQREKENVECFNLPSNEGAEYKRTHPLPRFYHAGKSYRGSWLDKDELLKVIDDNAYDILEYYYTYILIESCVIGYLDDWEREETWFKYNMVENKYFPCKKPKCFRNTFAFL